MDSIATINASNSFFDSNMNAVIVGIFLTAIITIIGFFMRKIWGNFLNSMKEKFDRIFNKIDDIETEIKTIRKENSDNIRDISEQYRQQNERKDEVLDKFVNLVERNFGKQEEINKKLEKNDERFIDNVQDLYDKVGESSKEIAVIKGKISK